MATLLGTTFSTDEQVMAQGDANFMGKLVESLVVKFDQAKYEEFLSFGSSSKSPRVALQYLMVSLEIRSQVSSEASPKIARANNAIYGHITCLARVNVSYETSEVNDVEIQSHCASPLKVS